MPDPKGLVISLLFLSAPDAFNTLLKLLDQPVVPCSARCDRIVVEQVGPDNVEVVLAVAVSVEIGIYVNPIVVELPGAHIEVDDGDNVAVLVVGGEGIGEESFSMK